MELNKMQHSQLITVEDQTSEDTLTAEELFNAVWAVNYQLMFHYGRSKWVDLGLAPSAHMMLLPHDADGTAKPPEGAWNIILMDESSEAGTLGWHDDGKNDIPYAEVFVKTARDDKVPWEEVLSHEGLEMIVDPFVDPTKPRTVTFNGFIWIVEVGDPVQGCGYDIGDPENRHCGVTVADFAEPSWFGMDSTEPYSFRRSVAKPFEIADDGYMSRAPENNPSKWEQLMGSMRSDHPKWASRLSRIASA